MLKSRDCSVGLIRCSTARFRSDGNKRKIERLHARGEELTFSNALSELRVAKRSQQKLLLLSQMYGEYIRAAATAAA